MQKLFQSPSVSPGRYRTKSDVSGIEPVQHFSSMHEARQPIHNKLMCINIINLLHIIYPRSNNTPPNADPDVPDILGSGSAKSPAGPLNLNFAPLIRMSCAPGIRHIRLAGAILFYFGQDLII